MLVKFSFLNKIFDIYFYCVKYWLVVFGFGEIWRVENFVESIV